jgi:predicted DNA-binding transcriptional regulator AlpA
MSDSPDSETSSEVQTIGKRELADALAWSRPRLDHRLMVDAQFPVHHRGNQRGGWQFVLADVLAHLGCDPPPPAAPCERTPDAFPAIVRKRELADALGWSRPTLDRALRNDPAFPVLQRGTQRGGWKFELATVRLYIAARRRKQ